MGSGGGGGDWGSCPGTGFCSSRVEIRLVWLIRNAACTRSQTDGNVLHIRRPTFRSSNVRVIGIYSERTRG
jgi:hypothetical protein